MRFSVLMLVCFVCNGICDASPKRTDGKTLSQQYCQSCHLLPEPSHLDKSTWVTKVFPIMRQYMGMDEVENKESMSHSLQAMYPNEPAMTEDEWFDVAQWYVDNAPLELTATPKPPTTLSATFKTVGIDGPSTPPMTTLVAFDSVNGQIILGDGIKNQLVIANTKGRILDSVKLTGPPSSVVIRGDNWYVTDLGDLFPHDTAIGALYKVSWSTGVGVVEKVLPPLLRPSDVKLIDMNGDGTEDFLVCEYGNTIGRFGWYDGKPSTKHAYHVLIPRAGAIRSQLVDVDGDGNLDIVVQMAQAREGLYAFIRGKKGFSDITELITFPPSYGSSSFSVTDWNSDGLADIIVTAGDNGDYDEPPFKPYHGARVFVNNGKLNFSEELFIAFDGCYGAFVQDFDGDGKTDVVAHSYFPNMEYKDAGLIQIRMDVKGANSVHTVDETLSGRWLTSTTADIDNDGDIDVILGNVSLGPGLIPDEYAQQWASGVRCALILVNTSR